MKTISMSNRFYYSELDFNDSIMIREDLRLYNSMVRKAYKYLYLSHIGTSLPFISLQKQMKLEFDTNDYFPQSVIWQAKAILKSNIECHKNYIDKMKKRIKQINKKIRDTEKKIHKTEVKINKLIAKTKQGKQTKEDYLLEVQILKPQLKILKNNLSQFKYRKDRYEKLSQRKMKQTCFGGRKLAKARNTVYETHKEWLEEYGHKRNEKMMITGRRQGKYSNNIFKYHVEEGIMVYRCTTSKEEIHLPITFHKNKELLERAILLPHNTPGKAVAYMIEDHHDYFIIKAIIDVEEKEFTFNKENGVIGIDINKDHIALCENDMHGNCIMFKNIKMDVKNKNTNQRMHIIRNTVKEVSDECMRSNKPLVIENLDFSNSKENRMLYQNKRSNQIMSEFAYKRITEAIYSRCQEDMVAVKKVDPSYTSQIGKEKYTKIMGCNTHMAASHVIGRRGQGFRERKIRNKTNTTNLLNINNEMITF